MDARATPCQSLHAYHFAQISEMKLEGLQLQSYVQWIQVCLPQPLARVLLQANLAMFAHVPCRVLMRMCTVLEARSNMLGHVGCIFV